MDHFNKVVTFPGLASYNDVAAYGWFRNLSDFIKKYLNLCSEDE